MSVRDWRTGEVWDTAAGLSAAVEAIHVERTGCRAVLGTRPEDHTCRKLAQPPVPRRIVLVPYLPEPAVIEQPVSIYVDPNEPETL